MIAAAADYRLQDTGYYVQDTALCTVTVPGFRVSYARTNDMSKIPLLIPLGAF
jgi:hypothetical protein